VDNKLDNNSYDHTAPWKCALSGCSVCIKKPTYYDYMRNKGLIKEKPKNGN